MKRKIDKLNRLVIPREMINELGIKLEDEVEIELKDNKVIITNPKNIDYKSIIEQAVELLKHQIDILESKDMFHNGEDELLNILKKGLK